MNFRRASWVWALVLSIAAHGAVVAAFTPDADDIAEAGSGAGSQVEGSIDAVLGTDVEFEDLVSEELKPALDTEIAAAARPMTLAALAPVPVEIAPAAMETPAAIAPAPAAELQPSEPDSTVAPTLAADIAAAPIESDLAAAPVETPPEITPTETRTASQPAEVKPVETPPAPTGIKPVEAKLAEATPVETKPVETKPIEAKPIEPELEETTTAEKPVEKPEPKKPTKEKTQRVEKAEKAKKTQKAEAPKRGNAEAESRAGAANADQTATARDNGTGRSREAGAGAAANSNYKGKVQSAIRRHTRTPSKAARMGITGRALVSFTVQPSGAAKNIVLASSSGNALLDNAALAAVRQASPFPRMPEGMAQISLTAPIIFESKRR
ncbi:TonB family protein [Kaistia adipata]|uniref:TonB family protein n=1 Tax=Kaistia adipata TaxID=166954 RepID=UPI0003F91B71|nr:TonB family protein [Kaistia adipata]